AADLPFGRAGCRVAGAWPQRRDCERPRDRPPDAIADNPARTDSCENTLRNWVTTGNSRPPIAPPQLVAPQPATPASRLFALALALPTPAACVGLRSARHSRRHKRAVGAHMAVPAAAPPDNPE